MSATENREDIFQGLDLATPEGVDIAQAKLDALKELTKELEKVIATVKRNEKRRAKP